MDLTFINHTLPFKYQQKSYNLSSTTSIEKTRNVTLIKKRSLIYNCSINENEKDRKQKEELYKQAEMIQDNNNQEVNIMSIWNNVIHKSLKRKLQGLVAEKPVTNGVSALLYSSPATRTSTSSSSMIKPTTTTINKKNPDDVIIYLLNSFKKDALIGASAFVSVASDNCHVKYTNPETLVLFIGDSENYRPLLRLTSFYINPPRFESSGNKCVISVEIHLPNVGTDESAKFDFQLSVDANNGNWLVDEVFRL